MSEESNRPCPACSKPIPLKHTHVCPACWWQVPGKDRVQLYQMTARKQNTDSLVAKIVKALKAKFAKASTKSPASPTVSTP